MLVAGSTFYLGGDVMLKRMLPLLFLLILCAGCLMPAAPTPDSAATEAAMVANVQATLTAGVPPSPTADLKATEAALVVMVTSVMPTMCVHHTRTASLTPMPSMRRGDQGQSTLSSLPKTTH